MLHKNSWNLGLAKAALVNRRLIYNTEHKQKTQCLAHWVTIASLFKSLFMHNKYRYRTLICQRLGMAAFEEPVKPRMLLLNVYNKIYILIIGKFINGFIYIKK